MNLAAGHRLTRHGRACPTAVRFTISVCDVERSTLPIIVVTGLVPVIHAFSAPMAALSGRVDDRIKSGHDEKT
jgi:hypothetical protein